MLLHLDETVAPESLDSCTLDLLPTVVLRVGPSSIEVSPDANPDVNPIEFVDDNVAHTIVLAQ